MYHSFSFLIKEVWKVFLSVVEEKHFKLKGDKREDNFYIFLSVEAGIRYASD